MCMKGLLGAYKKFKHCESYNPKEMLLTYMENLEDFAFMSKKVVKSAEKIKLLILKTIWHILLKYLLKVLGLLKLRCDVPKINSCIF